MLAQVGNPMWPSKLRYGGVRHISLKLISYELVPMYSLSPNGPAGSMGSMTTWCVNRAEGWRDRFSLYPRRVRERLPRILLPLAAPDPDIVLDIHAVLARTYDAGGYAERLNYDVPCIPPLAPEDQAWADTIIRHTGEQ